MAYFRWTSQSYSAGDPSTLRQLLTCATCARHILALIKKLKRAKR